MEVWKEISNYPYYKISNLGRVKSFRFGKEKEMKPCGMNGYLIVPLRNETRKNECIHRLVAKEFIPNPHNKPFINHINGIKSDNRVENLEWCTQKENVIHAYNIGLCSDKRGVNNGRAIVDESKVIEIRSISGKSTSQIARDLGLSWDCVYKIRKRKTWLHI